LRIIYIHFLVVGDLMARIMKLHLLVFDMVFLHVGGNKNSQILVHSSCT
jgi:hypothetical protein